MPHEQTSLTSLFRHWKDTSVSRKIFSAAIVILAFEVAVKVFTVGKELAIASLFGRGDDLEAFLIAFMIPALFISVSESAINAAVIPTFIRVRVKKGKETAQELLSGIVFLSLLLTLVLVLVLAAASPFLLGIIGSGFSAEKLALTKRLFYILSPTILINAVSCIYAAVLNADERFGLAKASSAAIPISILLLALTTATAWGVYSLAYGTLLGYILELTIVALALRKRWKLSPAYSSVTPELKEVIAQYFPMFGGALLMSSSYLVDQAMAAFLPAGSVAALSYANKIVSFPLGLAMTAVGTAVVPYFSRLVVDNQWQEIHRMVKRYLRLSLAAGAVAAALIILFSSSIVHVLFERGSFNALDTRMVAGILVFYALQIPSYIGSILFVRVISSSSANRILFWGATINVSINILLNYVLMRVMGVAGIALSTSIVFLVSFSFVFYHYYRIVGRNRGKVEAEIFKPDRL